MVFASECSSVRFLRERASEELQSGALTGSRGRRISSGMKRMKSQRKYTLTSTKQVLLSTTGTLWLGESLPGLSEPNRQMPDDSLGGR